MNLTQLSRGMQLYAGDVIGVTDPGPVATWLRNREAGLGEALRLRVASHVAIVIDSRGTRIIQAVWPRCRISGPERVHGRVVFVWRPRIPRLDKLVTEAVRYDGTPYDLPAIGAEWGFGKQDPKRVYCSELGTILIAAGGCQIPGEWTIKVEPFNMQIHAEAEQQIIYRSYRPWW
jgi:hypothetical protein